MRSVNIFPSFGQRIKTALEPDGFTIRGYGGGFTGFRQPLDHEKSQLQPRPADRPDQPANYSGRGAFAIEVLSRYYQLTKPGIIYGNDLSGIAGFLLASVNIGHFDFWLLVAFLAGMSLVIGSGCVLNNYIDRGIDSRMTRTKNRAIVTGQVKGWRAILYGISLGILGFAVLALTTNTVTVFLGGVGLFFYLIMYGFWKRHSPVGTVIGSVSGAIPITAGYTAVSGEIDAGAVILFLIMAFWQMPHFYSIATYRLGEYRSAGIPVLPAKHGHQITVRQSCLYIAAFSLACLSLALTGYNGYVFAFVMMLVSYLWLRKALRGFSADNNDKWGRQLFKWSLLVLLTLCIALPIGAFLP
jgi:protoheme IX farnesyltransferase